MPRTIRFHLDEDTDPAIAAGHRNRGIDVRTSQEMHFLGAVGTFQLSHSNAERRVLFTHDSDHIALSSHGIQHSGIAYCHQRKRSLGQMIAGLVLIWEVLESDAMRNRVEFI